MKTHLLIAALTLRLSLAQGQESATVASYRLTPDFPKYVTAHIEFRDPTGVRWPSILYGKPITNGSIRLGAPPQAAFTLVLNQRAQKAGDQTRRVLGELFPSTNTSPITLHVEGLSAVEAGNKGALTASLHGTVEAGGRKIAFKAPATLRPHAGKGDEKNEALFAELAFEAKAGELGLRSFDASAPIQVRAAFTAYSEAAIAAATSRIRPRP